jgi:SNF2 family DNA or RNA helicase
LTTQTVWGTSVTGNQPDAFARIKNNLRDIFWSVPLEDVADVPEWTFEDIEVDLQGEQLRLYNEMELTFRAELPEGDVLLAPNVLAQLLRLVQIASNPVLIDPRVDMGAKWKACMETLEYVSTPAIVWTSFITTAERMTELIRKSGRRVATLTGKTPQDDRQNIVDKFQGGDLDIIVAHPGVGKFGFTLTAGRTSIYLERGYNGDDYYQSLYRIRRIGTTVSPSIVHMIASRPNSDDPTIDRVIARILKYRMDSSRQLTSGLIREAFQGELN